MDFKPEQDKQQEVNVRLLFDFPGAWVTGKLFRWLAGSLPDCLACYWLAGWLTT